MAISSVTGSNHTIYNTSTSSVPLSFTINRSGGNTYYRTSFRLGNQNFGTSSTHIVSSGASNFTRTLYTSNNALLSTLSGGSSYSLTIYVYEFATQTAANNGYPVTASTSYSRTITVAVPFSNVSIGNYNLDSGGALSVSWSRPSTLSGWRAAVNINVNGTSIFTRYGFTTGMNYTPSAAEQSAMLAAMNSSSPRTITATVTGGFYAGSTTYNGAARSGSGSITKAFHVPGSVSVSGTVILSSNSGSQSFSGVSISQSGPTSGITYDISLRIGSTVIGSLNNTSGSGTKTISINRLTATTALKTSTGSSFTVVLQTKYNGSNLGSAVTATGGTIRPPYAANVSISSVGLNSLNVNYTGYSTGYTYNVKVYANGSLITSGTVGASGSQMNYSSASVINNISNGSTSVPIHIQLETRIGTSVQNTQTTGATNVSVDQPSYSASNFNIESNGALSRSSGSAGLIADISFRVGSITIKTWSSNSSSSLSTSLSTSERNSIYSAIAAGATSTSVSWVITVKSPNGNRRVGSVLTRTATANATTATVSSFNNFIIGTNPTVSITNNTGSSLTYKIGINVNGTTQEVDLSSNTNSGSINLSNNTLDAIFLNMASGSTTSTGITAYVKTMYGSKQIGSTHQFSTSRTASTQGSTISGFNDFNIEEGTAAITANNNYSGFSHRFIFKVGSNTSRFNSGIIASNSYSISINSNSDKEFFYNLLLTGESDINVTAQLETYYIYKTTSGSKKIGSTSESIKKALVSPISVSLGKFKINETFRPQYSYTSELLDYYVSIRLGSTTLISGTYLNEYIFDAGNRATILSSLSPNDESATVTILFSAEYNGKLIGSVSTDNVVVDIPASVVSSINNVEIEGITPILIEKSSDEITQVAAIAIYNGISWDNLRTSFTVDNNYNLSFTENEKISIYDLFSYDLEAEEKLIKNSIEGKILLTSYYDTTQIGETKEYEFNLVVDRPTISIPDSYFELEDTFNINITKGSNLFKYLIELYFLGEVEKSFYSFEVEDNNTSLNYELEIPSSPSDIVQEVYEKFYNKTRENITIRVYSMYENSENETIQIQSFSSSAIECRIKDSITPNIDSISFSDLSNTRALGSVVTSENVATYFGKFVQHISRPRMNVSGISAGRGANLSTYRISMDFFNPNTMPLNSSSLELNGSIITRSGTIIGNIVITDSRGRTIIRTLSIQSLFYRSPSISNFSTVRAIEVEEEGEIIYQESMTLGEYALISFDFTYEPLSSGLNPNRFYYMLESRLSNSGDSFVPIWNEYKLFNHSSSIKEVITTTELSTEPKIFLESQAFEFRIVVYDLFENSLDSTSTMSTIEVPFSISKYGISIKELRTSNIPESTALIVKGDSRIQGKIIVESTNEEEPPFVVDSSIRVDNLNADLLDGHDSLYFATADHLHDNRYLQLSGGVISGSLTVKNVLETGNHIIQKYSGNNKITLIRPKGGE